MRYIRIFTLPIWFIVLFAMMASNFTFAGTEDLIVKKVTRISHPAYRAQNIFYGVREKGVWNVDNTRIMISEAPDTYKHPTYGAKSRGLVWATLQDATSWTTQAEYEAAFQQVPQYYNRANKNGFYWSPFEGEENIIYTLRRETYNDVIKINVDTGEVTVVVKLGSTKFRSRAYGFRKDNNHLIASYNNENWDAGGWEIDLQAGTYIALTKADIPSYCDALYPLWPNHNNHGHGGPSPNGSKYAKGYGFARTIRAGTSEERKGDRVAIYPACTDVEDMSWENKDSPPYPWAGVHTSWHASENWFLSNSNVSKGAKQWPSAPSIEEYKIYQVYFDGSNFTYRELLSSFSAHRWDDGTYKVYNDTAHIKATIRSDGRQAIFTSTDGKYSYDDYKYKGATPWEFDGFFLVDLAFTSDESTISAPKGLKIQ